MPKIFEYLGIIIRFFSTEHDPIHVHAEYGDAVMIVSFYLKEGEIINITYKVKKGKFPPAKLKQLKEFVHTYQGVIVNNWIKYFIMHARVDFKRINKL